MDHKGTSHYIPFLTFLHTHPLETSPSFNLVGSSCIHKEHSSICINPKKWAVFGWSPHERSEKRQNLLRDTASQYLTLMVTISRKGKYSLKNESDTLGTGNLVIICSVQYVPLEDYTCICFFDYCRARNSLISVHMQNYKLPFANHSINKKNILFSHLKPYKISKITCWQAWNIFLRFIMVSHAKKNWSCLIS